MALGEHIGASRDAMNAVRQVVNRCDWEQLDSAVELFGAAFSRLRGYLERNGLRDAREEDLAGLRQLGIMHRKVMRQLSWHMRHTEEDLETINRMLH